MDMWTPYKSAVKESLPDAKIVVDKFHVVQLLNRTIEKERTNLQKTSSDMEKAILFNNRFLLTTAKEHLTKEEGEILSEIFDNYPRLRTAFNIKEAVRELHTKDSAEEAREYYEVLKDSIPDDMPEFVKCIKTVGKWKEAVFA
jgi:transposase